MTMLDSPVPGNVLEEVSRIIGNDPINYSQDSDLASDGSFGSALLILSQNHLIAAEVGKPPRAIRLADVAEARIAEQMGGARLDVSMKDGRIHRMIRYTKTRVPEFGVFCRVINDSLRNAEIKLPDPEGEAHCPHCGNQLPERGAHCPSCVNFFAVFRRLLGLLSPYRARLGVLIAATFVAVLAQVGPPYLTKEITDGVILGGQRSRLPWLVGGMLVCGAVYFVGRWTTAYLASWLASRLIADLRTKLHLHLEKLRLSYFHKRTAGELVSRVMNDTQELQQFLIDGLPYLFVNTLSFIAIAAVLLSIDWRLAILVFLPVPFLVTGVRVIWKRLHALFQKEGAKRGELHTILGESMRGLRAVKAAAREDERGGRFFGVNQDIFSVVIRIDRSYAAFSEGTFWVMSLGVAAVWYMAASRVSAANPAETLTLGDITAFVGYMWMFYGPLQWFNVIANWMNHAFASAERIFSVLDAEQEVYEAPGAVPMARAKGDVEFQDVRFSYERGKEVIKGVSFSLRPGEMIGLVGKSGAGKSTIVNLLCRFYEPDSGSVLIDGIPIEQIRLADLRKQIGIVMQDPFLFRASILDNIRYGAPDTPFELVVRAAKAAHAHDFIVDKEFGYDTIIGEGGITLSGGERQRIAIARAILDDPPILILDEATSSVDLETEKSIQDAVSDLIKSRATIAIAHRLATLRNATRLVVMDEGKVAQTGTHEELIASGGIYADLVKTQTELNKLRAEAAVT